LHEPIEHSPVVQSPFALVGLHVTPHAPQFCVVSSRVSQPSSHFGALQSPQRGTFGFASGLSFGLIKSQLATAQ